MTRARKSLAALGLCVLLGALLDARVGAVAGAVNADCFGNLDQTTYTSGFTGADFSSTTAVKIVPGVGVTSGVQLDTGSAPLDPQHIVLPFDQEVTVKLVHQNSASSHSLGWFYFDQVAPFLDGSGNLADVDADGIADFFQARQMPNRPLDGLWIISSGSVPDLTIGSAFSDGGGLDHVNNLIETYLAGGGAWIFKLTDDDTNTSTVLGLAPVADIESNADGIADYDVNGDGIVSGAARELDRSVNLGVIAGNREIVFFAMSYSNETLENKGVGLTGGGNASVGAIPWFSKNILNPDFQLANANAVLRTSAVGCSRDDAACYTARGATLGWLEQAGFDRLKTGPAYNGIDLSAETAVLTSKVGADGSTPHFTMFAPPATPNAWLMAWERRPNYVSGPSDLDFNDVAVLVERTNGGGVISQNIAAGIPAADLPSTMIAKIRMRFTASYPSTPAPGCTLSPDATVVLYYSVNGTSWRQVSFAGKDTGDETVDVLANGDVGNQLYWKANFISSSGFCQPILNSLNIGYEAVKHGEYKFAAPIPLSNVVYSGSVETPDPAWTVTRNDYSLRGHFRATQIFDPQTAIELVSQKWDAATALKTRSPDTRKIVTEDTAGAKTDLKLAPSSPLYSLVLPTAVRGSLMNGKLVYDFTGDGVVDDEDAKFIIEWTRGWEYSSAVPVTPTQSPLQRAWKLGAINNSSPALIGPPGTPSWTEGSAAPPTFVAAFKAYQLLNAKRTTLAVVGAQDGMLHAFSAGQFRNGADADCGLTTPLLRGCFAPATPDYGDGSEAWAWVPPSQLSQLKNNHPVVANYLPAANVDAEVDGSVSVEDMYLKGSVVTAIMASLGRNQPYVTGVYITDDPGNPKPLWTEDWTDPDYHGSEFSPASGLAAVPVGARWITVISSGLSSSVGDEFVFLIDSATGKTLVNSIGTTIGKIKLNTGVKPGGLGIGGYLNMVDADGDGLLDRVYAIDVSGRVFKVDLTTLQSCQIATLGESVFVGAAISQLAITPPKVRLFVGGAPNPDGTASPPNTAPYHLFAIEDDDVVGGCGEGAALIVYTQTLDPSDKLWAAPFASGDQVFFATSTGNSQSVCAVSSGTFFGIESSGGGSTYSIIPGSASLPGTAVSSLRIYDGHAFVNSVSGKTTMIGGTGWNNNNGAVTKEKVQSLTTVLWQEL